jgi:hypothetical protein
MIDIDENLAKMNLNYTNYREKMDKKFDFSTNVMDDPNTWIYYEGYLIMYIVQKFVFTALTLSIDVPGGIFTPSFAIGAVFGQLYVSAVIEIFSFFKITNFIQCKYNYLNLTYVFVWLRQRNLLYSWCCCHDWVRHQDSLSGHDCSRAQWSSQPCCSINGVHPLQLRYSRIYKALKLF